MKVRLSDKQIEFICEECSITQETLFAMNDETLYDTVYEVMCKIEIDEACASPSGDDSERCEIASDIVTILGNALAKEV